MSKRNRKNVQKTEEQVTDLGPNQEEADALDKHLTTQEQVVETSPESVEPQEVTTEDGGTEEPVAPFSDVPEPEQDIVDPDPVAEIKQTRRAAVKEDSTITVLFTENPQRQGTKSYNYNNILAEKKTLTVKEAMDLGVPRHHINYLAKEGHISAS